MHMVPVIVPGLRTIVLMLELARDRPCRQGFKINKCALQTVLMGADMRCVLTFAAQ
ncbi:MAG: hypothetical protein RIR97_619 [Pseudomonadota bacterium]